MIYLLTLFVSLVLQHSNNFIFSNFFLPHRKVDLRFLLPVLPFLFVTLLRYDVGTDYMQYFFGYLHSSEIDDKELIFQWLIDFSHFINFQFLLITLFGMMVCFFTFYCIFQLSNNVNQSIFLFFFSGFFFFSLTMMRQSASTALFFFALIYLFKKKYITYFVLTLICSLLHTTGITYLVLGIVFLLVEKNHYFEKLLKPKYLIVLTLMLFIFGHNVRNLLLQLSIQIETYAGYFDSDQDTQNASGTFLLFGVTPFISYLFAHIKPFGLNYEIESNRLKYVSFTLVSWLSLVTGILRALIPNGERIVFLFEPIAILSIPYFVNFTKPKYRKISLYFSYLCFVACVFWYYYVKQSLNMFPYHFIFLQGVDIW